MICGNHNYIAIDICNILLQPDQTVETQLQTCLHYKIVSVQPIIQGPNWKSATSFL